MLIQQSLANANIRPGDVIVGLSSTGQATYEKKYNGGMGSNGLTSARHDVFAKYLAENYPESYDHAVPDELVYSGKYKLTDDKLFIPCGGADDPRPIKLRRKGNGQWFLWEQYLMTGIRIPTSADPWA